MKAVETDRLILRTWRQEDAEVFAKINQNEKVIKYLAGPMSVKDCENFIIKANAHFEKNGFGLWAATIKETGELIGFVGLSIPDFESDFTPCVEIGWRLASNHWGKGYATQAAKEVLKIGFEKFNLKEIVSFTTLENSRSMAVMERIGMKRDVNGDFNHPKLNPDHPIVKHALYRIKNL